MKCYKGIIKTMGPVFVGDGGKLEKSDYVLNINNKMMYVMDTFKMFQGLKKIGKLEAYEDFMLNNRYSDLYSFIKDNELLNDYADWAKYSYYVDFNMKQRGTQISTCIKDAYNKPYIPGSSIKGALRNAILNAELITNNRKYSSMALQAKNETYNNRKGYLAGVANSIEKKAGFIDDDKDKLYSKFTGIRVSDSNPLSKKDIIMCAKLDTLPMHTDAKKRERQLPVLRECIKPNTTIEFTLEIDERFCDYSLKDIENSIGLMYNNIYDKFLSAYSLEKVSTKLNPLYIGGGVGYQSKTVTYSLFDDKNEAVETVSVILDNVDSKKQNKNKRNGGKNGDKMGNHLMDPDLFGVSPHMRKCTLYRNMNYDFGLCSVSFEPIG